MVVKQILEILKKYWLSVLCGVVALLAVLATWVWPLPGHLENLQTTLDQRKSVYSNVDLLRKATRPMPVIEIGNQAADTLGVFPSQGVIDAGETATAAVTKEAAAMLETAVRMNVHTLLLDQSLPEPSGPVRFQFRDIYLDLMEADPARRPGRPLHFKDTILRAVYPPSPQELEVAKAEVAAKYETLQGNLVNPAQAAQHKESMDAEIAVLPDRLRALRAREGRIYLNPNSLSVNPSIRGNAAPTPEAIWSAQLMTWIQEDFCRAVAGANDVVLSRLPADARQDVTTAPIKHLIQLTVSPDPRLAIGDPHTDPNAPLPDQPAVTLTRRVSNALYETYRFGAVLNVETAKIPVILQELSRSQFLTIVRADVVGADSFSALQQGFVYGTQPVATLTLECELLYMRKWCEPLMPPSVKARLAVPGAGAPGAVLQAPNPYEE